MLQKHHPLYHRWKDIKYACSNPNSNDWHWAGARGIELRFSDFWEFVEYVETQLGSPEPGQRLHRINQHGHYEPGNLTWTSPQLASRNAMRTHGKTEVTDFCRYHGFNYSTVRWRLEHGWTLERILENPPPQKRFTE